MIRRLSTVDLMKYPGPVRVPAVCSCWIDARTSHAGDAVMTNARAFSHHHDLALRGAFFKPVCLSGGRVVYTRLRV